MMLLHRSNTSFIFLDDVSTILIGIETNKKKIRLYGKESGIWMSELVILLLSARNIEIL